MLAAKTRFGAVISRNLLVTGAFAIKTLVEKTRGSLVAVAQAPVVGGVALDPVRRDNTVLLALMGGRYRLTRARVKVSPHTVPLHTPSSATAGLTASAGLGSRLSCSAFRSKPKACRILQRT